MSEFEIALPDGRSIVVDAPDAQSAAKAARLYLSKESGRADAKTDGTAQAFGQGATFGFGDEITAAVRAAAPGFSNWMMRPPALQRDESIGGTPPAQTVSNAPTFDQRYEEELARERAKGKQFSKDNPKTAMAANAGGNLATTVAASMAGVPVGPSMGGNLTGNVLKLGATGAGYGGVQGFGEGEGDFYQRGAHAIPAAGIGAIIGGALPIVGVGARAAMETAPGRWITEKAISPALAKLARLIEGTPKAKSLSAAAPDGTPDVSGPLTSAAESTSNVSQSGALERITTAIQRSGLSEQQIKQKLRDLGPEGFLADLDPQLLSEARRAHTLPGETKTWAKTVLEARDRQAPNRMHGVFEGNEPPPPTYKLRGENQAFDEHVRAVGAQAYQGDMIEAGLKQSPELMALYENPKVKGAIDRILGEEKASRIGTSREPASPVEIMHKVKREIANIGFGPDGRPTPTAAWWQQTADDFIAALKKANPALAEADVKYSLAKSLSEHFDRGRDFLAKGTSDKAMNASEAGLDDLLATANPQQTIATRAGGTNAVRETVETSDDARRLAKRITTSDTMQRKLERMYDPEQAAKIVKLAEAELTFGRTKNDILGGSKSIDKLVEAMDGSLPAPPSIVPQWLRMAWEAPNALMKPNETVRNEIGRATLNPSAEQNARMLARALEMLERRKRGVPGRASLAGSVGAEMNP